MLQRITLDVHGHWDDKPPVYRIYVNNDLLTERTFGWPQYKIFIRENMVCDLEPGIQKLRIENVTGYGRFIVDNLTVEGRTDALHPNHGTEPTGEVLTFIVN